MPKSSSPVRRVTRMHLKDALSETKLVVAEQALRHVDTHALLACQVLGGTPVALWGHGRTLVKPVSPLSRWALRRMTNRACWFFAYTESARDAVARGGFPRERVTVVQNAIDTERLVRRFDAVTDDEIARTRRDLDLPARGVCIFVGTLSRSKRIEFLVTASDLIAKRVPQFALVVAGDGPERGLVEDAAGRYEWLRYVGAADGRCKALLGHLAELMIVPGRVGLVAVDSFALRTPIVTTCWPFHGPEFEYLEHGRNAIVTDDRIDAFAEGVESALRDEELLGRMTGACEADARVYTLEAMVRNFSYGVLRALEAPHRRFDS